MLIKFSHPLLKLAASLNGELWLDDDFAIDFEHIIAWANTVGITLLAISGFRKNSDHLTGAIVTPAKKSCHFTGCAVDVNFYLNNKLYNSSMLKNHDDIPTEIKKVIEQWEGMGYQWGGNFTPADEVHLDNDLYHRHPALWQNKYTEYHQAA